LDVTVSDSPESQPTVDRPTTTKEEKLHGVTSEEAADNTSVVSLELIEELHGVTVTQPNRPEYTQDASPSLISVKPPVRLPLRKLATKPVEKATQWLETGVSRDVTPTTQESTRDTDTTDCLEREKSLTDDT
jgi:hypothetical protein